jgi:hypothetical protein
LSECLNYDGNIKEKFFSLFSEESIYPSEDKKEEIDSESKSLEEVEEEDIDFESDTLDGENKSSTSSGNISEGNNNNDCFNMGQNKNPKKQLEFFSLNNHNLMKTKKRKIIIIQKRMKIRM